MKRYAVVLTHIAFWSFSLFIDLLPFTTLEPSVYNKDKLLWMFVSYAFLAVVFYLFYCVFVPKTLSRKKVWLYIVILFLFSAFYAWLMMNITPFLTRLILDYPPKPIDDLSRFIWNTSFTVAYALWGTMFRFTIDWFRTFQRQKELEKQSIASELALLRSQINPHFLFNTLNNINSFVYTDQDKTSFGIIKLSDIMRYMLFESNSEKVPLDKEIEYIRSYISLQGMRVKDPDYVSFSVKGNTQGIMLPPMLLIPFIENAFKHGSKRSKIPGIIIEIELEEKELKFRVVNYLPETVSATESSGFGLKNIRRRLDLLFPEKYLLNINSENDIFTVELIIQKI